MDEALYALALVVGGFFIYSRFREVQCERFENKITTRKYTLKELCELLQIVKNTLQKDGDVYHLIDVRNVEFTMTGASVVFTAFNHTKWTTKLYKGHVSRGGNSAEITENMLSFDEQYVENKAFGTTMGMHDSEALRNIPFLGGDVAKLSRYTFTRDKLASTAGETSFAFDENSNARMLKIRDAPSSLPGTPNKKEILIASLALRDHYKKPTVMHPLR